MKDEDNVDHQENVDQQNPKEKPVKPKKSRLTEWNRSKVKHNDRNGRWELDED